MFSVILLVQGREAFESIVGKRRVPGNGSERIGFTSVVVFFPGAPWRPQRTSFDFPVRSCGIE